MMGMEPFYKIRGYQRHKMVGAAADDHGTAQGATRGTTGPPATVR